MKKVILFAILSVTASIVNVYGSCGPNGCGVGQDPWANVPSSISYRPCENSCCGRMGFGFEVLFLRASEDCIEHCHPTLVSDTAPPLPPPGGMVLSFFEGIEKDPDFKWGVGFRLSLGFAVENQKWDFLASWTHFNTSAGIDDFLGWRLYFDTIDIAVLYNFQIGRSVMIRPWGGIEGLNINQYLQQGEFPYPFPIFPDEIINFIDDKQHTKAIGPIIGLEADWDIGCGFSFYANLSAAWLFGDTDVTIFHVDQFFNAIDHFQLKKDLHASLVGENAMFGFRWHCCSCSDLEMIFSFGLEHHRYYDINRLTGCGGDLSIDGFNIGFELAF